jgi:hypothetical protein
MVYCSVIILEVEKNGDIFRNINRDNSANGGELQDGVIYFLLKNFVFLSVTSRHH